MDLQSRVYQECSQRYEVLVAQVNYVYQSAIRQEDRKKYSFEQVMEQVDVYIQSIMLGIALSDKDVSKEEIDLINKITKYGNIFRKSKIDVEKTNFNGFLMKMQISKVAQTNANAIPAIFVSIAEIDKKMNSDCFYFIAPKIVELLCFFMAADGNVGNAEKRKLKELIEPLFKMFPNSKAKL